MYYEGMQKAVYREYLSIDFEELSKSVGKLLDIEDFKEATIRVNEELPTEGMHCSGNIEVSIRKIWSVFSQKIYDKAPDENGSLLKLFIEAILVHELHHFYMWQYRKDDYDKFKVEDRNKKYLEKRLEKKAIDFEKVYLDSLQSENAQEVKEYRMKRYSYQVNRM